jgi:hypothetical protein
MWVQSLYFDLLGRASATPETDYWEAVLDRGVSHDTIASAFLTSRERRASFIDQYYQDYLGRPVDAAGLDYWLDVWQRHNGPEIVRASLIGSAEYYAAHGGTPAGAIQGLYNDILGRNAVAVEVAYWDEVLTRTPLSGISLGFLTSDEYRLGLISDWYQEFLDRPSESAGGQFWLNHMKHGMPQHQIQALLIGSQEYRDDA